MIPLAFHNCIVILLAFIIVKGNNDCVVDVLQMKSFLTNSTGLRHVTVRLAREGRQIMVTEGRRCTPWVYHPP